MEQTLQKSITVQLPGHVKTVLIQQEELGSGDNTQDVVT